MLDILRRLGWVIARDQADVGYVTAVKPMITKLQFAEIFPRVDSQVWLDAINAAMVEWDILTPLRAAHWLAQIGHESGGLVTVDESFRYSPSRLAAVWPFRFAVDPRAVVKVPNDLAERLVNAGPVAIANSVYANRNGNGNEASGDGWRFRGRSPVQLTGRGNYAKAGGALGLDLVRNPDLALDPMIGARIAGWFWRQGTRLDLNLLADNDDIMGITVAINGGHNGLDDRQRRLTTNKRVLLAA